MPRTSSALTAALAAAVCITTGCGSTQPTPSAGSPTSAVTAAVATPSPTATPPPTPTPTAPPPAATATQLQAVGSAVFPPCASACAAQGAMFTVCDSGASPRWAKCPLTSRLIAQLEADVQGVQSAPDPLGGGQDPEWATESITADPTPTGGVVHVVLGFGGGPVNHTDLLVVEVGGQLLVDDVSCTGTVPAGADAYASGWLNRSTCSS